MSNYLSRHNADADDETERWHAALEAWVADERAAEAEDEKRRQARERAAAEAEAEHDPDAPRAEYDVVTAKAERAIRELGLVDELNDVTAE